jgi:hypothetical protein
MMMVDIAILDKKLSALYSFSALSAPLRLKTLEFDLIQIFPAGE